MPDREPVEGVVFDADGVLVDSEGLSWEAWRRVVERHGQTLDEATMTAFTGRTDIDLYEELRARGPLPPFEAFSEEIAEVMYRLFDRSLEAFEDAVDTVDHLRMRGVPIAVASSSPRERLDRALFATGLDERFELTVAGDEVARAKPAPDLYLAAAEALGIAPSRLVAVEDSPTGIAAAKAAGMRTVAVIRGPFAPSTLASADRVVPRLTPATLAW